MATLHNLGFPRIGAQRELKFALEDYWAGHSSAADLQAVAAELRQRHWQQQADSGLDWLPLGDFSLYDQVLDTSFLLGNLPPRYLQQAPADPLQQYFRVARGRAPGAEPARAGEMTKWFDSNYHYIVPEFSGDSRFQLQPQALLAALQQAHALGLQVKPVVLGPLSYLWLGKSSDGVAKLALLPQLLEIYGQLLALLAEQGVDWVQIDEPILALDLPQAWRNAFEAAYNRLQTRRPKLLLATYFGPLQDNLSLFAQLPVDGLHLDAVRARHEVEALIDKAAGYKVLSLGVIDGRNIWRTDLNALLDWLEPIQARLGERLWLAPSCSLLHVPVDLQLETALDPELRSWLAFARQKLQELQLLGSALNQGRDSVAAALAENAAALASRKTSTRVHQAAVRERLAAITPDQLRRQSPFAQRRELQQARFSLPLFPTTSIGSFPQTPEIRRARSQFRSGELTSEQYRAAMEAEIRFAVAAQESLGLDVLVHGEAERNDMVEYFGEQLQGYGFTRFGWVQSYGSRCVKPPIIYGDVSRPQPMTLAWTRYAQSLTDKPMKGMLSGPITMLQWSFVRDDQPRALTARQIALALRDEVVDLEAAGIGIIQVDEPALREGLPLRRADWSAYLGWAVDAFRLATAAVADDTQIHTHMCYAEFNDIIEAIADLDADVITIETSRSAMELLDAFVDFRYPNDIGPGVYDIHSPNIPSQQQMLTLLRKALQHLPPQQLWVNPDCGLKTRGWAEVQPALQNMVAVAQQLRAEHSGGGLRRLQDVSADVWEATW